MAPKKSKLRNLPKKAVSTRKTEAVKGGRKQERIAGNHNQTLRA